MGVTLDATALLTMIDDHAEDRAARLAEEFVAEVQANASRRTGALAESVTDHPPVVSPGEITTLVTVDAQNEDGDYYGQYSNEGTGIFGPEGVPITPKNGNVLVFDWPAAGGIVFARSVRGSEPTHFWDKALEAWPQIVARVGWGG